MAYYYTRDHLGSMREMCSLSGSIVARYSYDPCGRITLVSGSNLATKQYAGYYAHQTGGLLLTFAGDGDSIGRPYDPATGRWLSRDSIGENGGLNHSDADPNHMQEIRDTERAIEKLKKWIEENCEPPPCPKS